MSKINNSLKGKSIEFLSSLEGYMTVLKELHWSAEKHSIHILTDDMGKSILEYEDRIAECVMGILDTRIVVGDLKCLLPESKTLDSLIKELSKDTISLKKEIEEEIEYSGLVNILDEFMSDINKWNYLKNLC
jgi:hypothetical protein